ncbi:MAG: methylmalonyl Co-A mutase-associated GTPase MeaB, partial [Deltaproteobacteria bacterium CG_4_9_14_3_um_filter_63_12]
MTHAPSLHSRAQRVLAGETIAAARLIRDVDDRREAARADLRELFPHVGKAHIIGVTGSPGVGKSSLVDALITEWRARGKTVAVVAVDPSSPFTGGAILGDRIRMQTHSLDPGVFIRSVASRGFLGGLSPSIDEIVLVFDAMGFDVILVETVGVGQGEVDIIRSSHTTLVVLSPNSGDDVQGLKAGLLEVADIFVVNKADLPGADRTRTMLKRMVNLGQGALRDPGWAIPTRSTSTTQGTPEERGIAALVDACVEHRDHLRGGPGLAERN